MRGVISRGLFPGADSMRHVMDFDVVGIADVLLLDWRENT